MKGFGGSYCEQAEGRRRRWQRHGASRSSRSSGSIAWSASALPRHFDRVLAVAFGICFGAWIYRSISKPLSRLISVTDEIAAGNLSHQYHAHDNDEIGRVEASVAKMVQNLKEIVGKIRLAASGLASSSEELSATAEPSTRDQASRRPRWSRRQAPWWRCPRPRTKWPKTRLRPRKRQSR